MRIKRTILIFFCLNSMFSCNNASEILPKGTLKKSDKDHCWPYNFHEYLIQNLGIQEIESFPKNKYFGRKSSKNQITKWKKASEMDTLILSEIYSSLHHCEKDKSFALESLKTSDVYISGSYFYMRDVSGGKIKRYRKILVLIPQENTLYLFKEVGR